MSRAPQTFGANVVRRMWYRDTWYYSVIDVVAVLAESVNLNNCTQVASSTSRLNTARKRSYEHILLDPL